MSHCLILFTSAGALTLDMELESDDFPSEVLKAIEKSGVKADSFLNAAIDDGATAENIE